MNWSMRLSVAIVMSFFTAGCSRSSMPKKYVSESTNEVDMFELVEAPAGHLSGTLVISAIDQDGNRKPDVVRSVAGSIYHGNIALQIGDSGILVNQVNAIGTLDSDEMRLDIGGNSQNFIRTTTRKYGDVLVSLSKNGDNIKIRNAAVQQAKELSNFMESLDTELLSFIAWGNDRINNMSHVHDWYANRAVLYKKCIDSVQPLALRHIPSWHWQSCVINIENDTYNRRQMSDAIEEMQNRQRAEEQDLDAKISSLPHRVLETTNMLSRACSFTTNEADCKANLDSVNKEIPPPTLSLHINEYRKMLPQLRSTIEEDAQSSAIGEKELSELASQANSLLRSAH